MTTRESFDRLGLRYAAQSLDEIIAQAVRDHLSHQALLERVVDIEITQRSAAGYRRRRDRSRLGVLKPMSDFDWAHPRQLDRAAVERALSLDFLPDGNLVLLGPTGSGKSLIAKNVVHQALAAGHSALFVELVDLVRDLAACATGPALERRLRHYSRPRLLCIDEVDYRTIDLRGAELLYEVVRRRHERRSTLVTTTRLFSDWPALFPSSLCAVAIVDRLMHKADVIAIDADSYRHKEARSRAARVP